MSSKTLNFFVTCAKGMESILGSELSSMGIENPVEVKAGVKFSGSLAQGYRVCLHSRIANRVLLVLRCIDAHDAEELYQGIKQICWSDHITSAHTMAVDFLATQAKYARNQNIIHTHFGALKVKDAIVDQFREKEGARPSVDPVNPDVRINVYLEGDKAFVSIDLSGDSLHKRGYRSESAQAPLKENLAAALLMMAGWHEKQDYNLIDPMCGSGTILIEAGLMAKNIAPGLLRTKFGFLHWCGHQKKQWQELIEEAEAGIKRGRKNLPKIIGYDKDARALEVALSNIEKAGLTNVVSCAQQDLAQCEPVGERGIFITNPPYGERLGEIERLRGLYKQLGDVMKQRFKGWEGYIFTSSSELAKCIGLKSSRRFVLYNGALECRLLKFDLY